MRIIAWISQFITSWNRIKKFNGLISTGGGGAGQNGNGTPGGNVGVGGSGIVVLYFKSSDIYCYSSWSKLRLFPCYVNLVNPNINTNSNSNSNLILYYNIIITNV